MPITNEMYERLMEKMKQLIINNAAQQQTILALQELAVSLESLISATTKIINAMSKHIQAENGQIAHLMSDMKEMHINGKEKEDSSNDT